MLDSMSVAMVWAFLQVVMIDLVMAADNIIVLGLAAAGLPTQDRRRVIFWGVLFATVLRIFFALITSHLLNKIGLLFAGGLLLMWVAWKMWRQLHHVHGGGAATAAPKPPKSFYSAVLTIVLADVSMSLDNVLAVAGAAREHLWVLVFGLAFSVVLMGLATTTVAKLMHRYKWIGYVGLLIVVYVALDMTYRGYQQIQAAGWV